MAIEKLPVSRKMADQADALTLGWTRQAIAVAVKLEAGGMHREQAVNVVLRACLATAASFHASCCASSGVAPEIADLEVILRKITQRPAVPGDIAEAAIERRLSPLAS